MDHFTRHKKQALLFLVPQLIVTIVFFIWPSCNAIVQSLFFSDAFGLHHRFSGLQNYLDLLIDPGFIKALMVSLTIGFLVTCLTLGTGLMLAFFVNQRQKSQIWYKSLLLCPYAVAPAVAAILWRFLC
jgi:sn-glycerol 3-phosphate transport system permease protein